MTKRKSYDDKFRASAVVMLEAAGYPHQKGALTHVADHLDVPAMTLMRWFRKSNNPPPNEVVIEKRGEFADLFRDELYAIFAELPNKREDASYSQLSTTAGIFMDKLRLLSGQSTQNEQLEVRIRRVSAQDER